MSAHTPGPWTQDPTGDVGYWLIGTAEKPVCEVISEHTGPVESRANGRLIAAAPDLLTALRMARHYVKAQHGLLAGAIGEDNMISPDLAVIDAAVAKAEGR